MSLRQSLPHRSDGTWSPITVRSDSRAAWFVVLPLGLSVALPLFLVSDVPDAHRSSAWMVTLAVLVWSGFRLSVLCVRGRPDLFDFFFWLFCYIFIGLGATVQLRSSDVAITTPGMDPRYDLPGALVVATGIVMYEVGRVIGCSRARRPSPVQRPSSAPASDVSERRVALLLLGSLLLTSYFVAKVGLGSLFSNREAMRVVEEGLWPDPAVSAVVSAVATFPLLVAAGGLAQLRMTAGSPTWRRTARALLPVCALLLLLVENPVVSARYTFGTVAFALAVYFGAVRTKARVRVTMIGTLAGFLFAFPLADAFRYSDGVRDTRSGFFGEYAGNGDYDSFWQIVNAYTYWQQGLVEPVRQFLGSTLFWVPRSIWPTKPTDTGILLANYRGYSFDNLSAPVWAEALVNGGLIGVVIVFLALGYALARSDRRLPTAVAGGGVWGIVGAVLPVYLTILLRGSLLQATGALAVTVACMVFVRRPASERPQRS